MPYLYSAADIAALMAGNRAADAAASRDAADPDRIAGRDRLRVR